MHPYSPFTLALFGVPRLRGPDRLKAELRTKAMRTAHSNYV